jgi:tellurite resistance protein TehA-like permease
MDQIEHGRLDHGSSQARDRARLKAALFLAAWIRREAMALDPACFSLVMATGIVSNAYFLQGYHIPSDALLAVNIAAYPWLCLLTGWRAARSPIALSADLLSPRMVFSFFTFVAASGVFGLGLELRGFSSLAFAMWLVAIASWAGLIYLGFGELMLLNNKDGADVADGGWLNAIVATQSLVILGAHAALPAAAEGSTASMLIYALWTLGLGLYGVYAVLLCQRLFFHDLNTADVGPLLWVVMGAAAINANAGATLAGSGGRLPFLQSLQPFVDGVTLAMWAWATWWIPLLLLLGIWKHGIRRVPIIYTPMLWSIVFPLGMYAVTSWRLSRIADLPIVGSWAAAAAWIALAAWCTTSVALIAASFRSIRALGRLDPGP